MRSTTQLAIAALALPLLACGGSVQPEPGVSPKDAPKLLAPAICFQAYRCCSMTQLMGNDNAGVSMDTCEMKTETALTNEVSAIEASERKGRVNYDGLKVQACLDYLKAADTTCDDLNMTFHLPGVPACANFLEPLVAVGGACTNDFECIDAFCDKSGAAAGAEGACRALGKMGESCANMGRCEPDLDCDAGSMMCVARPTPPPGTPTPPMCFYSTACSAAGGAPGPGTALGVGLLLATVVARRRRRAQT